MTFLRKYLEAWRRQREILSAVKDFHTESRTRVAQLAAEGRADVAVRENALLMGIDLSKAERPRIVTLKGVRL